MSALLVLDRLAEARIEEALAAGELEELPGTGRPLELDDDSLVPVELRAAYRVLRNAGFVPPEVAAHKELATLAALIAALKDGAERSSAVAKLALLQARLEAKAPRGRDFAGYRERILSRFAR